MPIILFSKHKYRSYDSKSLAQQDLCCQYLADAKPGILSPFLNLSFKGAYLEFFNARPLAIVHAIRQALATIINL